MKILEEFNNGLLELMNSDNNVILIGEDLLDPYGGAFKVTKGLSTKFPNRVIPTTISEQFIVGCSVGMALRGLKPIAEIMFSDFLTLAADQLINHASKYVSMYGKKLKINLVIRTPVGAGRGYGPTHSQSLEKIFLGIKDLFIVAPSIFNSFSNLISKSINLGKPVIFIEHKLLYGQDLIFESNKDLFIEKTNDYFENVIVYNYDHSLDKPDLTIISYGGSSLILRDLLLELKDDEIKIKLLLITNVSPINKQTLDFLLKYTSKDDLVLIVEENPVNFSWSSEILSLIFNNVKYVSRIGSEFCVIPTSRILEEYVILNKNKVKNKILEILYEY